MAALKAVQTDETDSSPAGYFMAAVADDTTASMVRGVARELGWADPILRDGGVVSAIGFIRTTEPPAVLVIDLQESSAAMAASELRALKELCPNTCLIALGLTNDIRYYRQLRDAGARDYLVKPVTAEHLREAISAGSSGHEAAPAAEGNSHTIALIGARGGVGVTTLATSLSWALAQEQKKVVMLDLDLHFGSAALSLDLEPGRGLRELLTHPDRIDRLLIDAAANDAGERFRLLSAEEPLEDDLDLAPEGLSVIVHDLSANANFVVVDVPRTLGPLNRSMIATAEKVIVVTDLSLPAMRDTQRLVSMIRVMRKNDTPMVVANRVGGVAGEIGVKEFEKATGVKIAHSIPYDRQAAVAAAETAKPLIQAARNAKTVAAVKGLAREFLGATDKPAAAPAKSKKLFGR